MLTAIAVLLAGGGTLLFWLSGFGDEEPLVRSDRIGDLCEMAVDEELLGPWADAEQAREPTDRTEDEVRTFDCTYSAEHSGDDAYRLVTFFATVQVYESVADARAAHAGVLEFEDSEGHQTSSVGGVADEAALATVTEGEETELRLHAQEANTTLSLNLFLTGTPPEGGDGPTLAKDLASGLIGALPREGN
ncbi:hypothetical protein [Glycomyces xiaoerkulensis]|uniref:hypothetical protein n=1 Tax=Glycomyces xiaoerkulensis TaxID=2038139 RepID=UPI000C25C5B4|nr:hypothetical protein [Glycomyces xiaoerkulensis]